MAHTVTDTWLADGAILAHLHLPEARHSRVGVVLCPPLGQDHIITYRSQRLLAHTLADAGIPVIRFDYPGFGDSTETPSDGALVRGPQIAADALRNAACAGIVYAGLGSGAFAADAAAATDEDAAGLVLWDPPPSARWWLRRQRSLFALALGSHLEPAPAGLVVIAGAELTDSFVAALAGMRYHPDLADTMPILVAHRDTSDDTLPSALRPAEAKIDVVSVSGHEDAFDVSSVMAGIPGGSVDTVAAWIINRYRTEAETTTAFVPKPLAVETVSFGINGVAVTETLRRVGPDRLFGVETAPAGTNGGPAVLLHTGSSEHRIGATRHQVDLARRLATHSIRSLRLDRRGTGETGPVTADEHSLLFTREWLEDGEHALDYLHLSKRDVGVVGLCAGGWVGLFARPEAARFVAIIGMNDYRTRAAAPDTARLAERAGHTPIPDTSRFRRRVDQALSTGVAFAKQHFPHPITVALASRGYIRFAEPALRRAIDAGADVLLYLAPDDKQIFRDHGGDKAMTRLANGPGALTVTSTPTGDHSLFSPGIRRRAIEWALYEALSRLVP